MNVWFWAVELFLGIRFRLFWISTFIDVHAGLFSVVSSQEETELISVQQKQNNDWNHWQSPCSHILQIRLPLSYSIALTEPCYQ